MSVRKVLLIKQSLTDVHIEANLRLKNGTTKTLGTRYEDFSGEKALLIPLLQFLKLLKLCKAPERNRGFGARPNLARGNTAMHKRKLHIMALMQSFA
jgi:hypothetical protein